MSKTPRPAARRSSLMVTALAELSNRLREIAVTVTTLKYHVGPSKSWEIVATKGKDSIRFLFNEADNSITAEISSAQLSNAPFKWSRVDAKVITDGYVGAIAYAEEFLRQKFS